MTRAGPSAAEIASMLAQRTDELVRELLPTGRKDGQEWRCGNLRGDAGQSLAVRLSGARAGVWCDFSSGEKGDALDLVAAARFGGDRGQALRWARNWLGIGHGAPVQRSVAPAVRPAVRRPIEDPEAAKSRARARSLFLQGAEVLAGTPAAAYLAGRGIDLGRLGRQPRALRYHPRCWCRETGGPLPAMLAAISAPDGGHAATHRTWLAPVEGGGWQKARLRDPKKVMGAFAGGTIRLWRGASSVPLERAPEGEMVAIAEGIETALSVAIAVPELRVLAAVSVANMRGLVLPSAVRCVLVCADNDAAGSGAEQALRRAIDRWIGEGREVRVARSPVGKDFNDCLQAEGSI